MKGSDSRQWFDPCFASWGTLRAVPGSCVPSEGTRSASGWCGGRRGVCGREESRAHRWRADLGCCAVSLSERIRSR